MMHWLSLDNNSSRPCWEERHQFKRAGTEFRGPMSKVLGNGKKYIPYLSIEVLPKASPRHQFASAVGVWKGLVTNKTSLAGFGIFGRGSEKTKGCLIPGVEEESGWG